jgi:hypothetical protein
MALQSLHRLEREPRSLFRFVDEVLDDACAGYVAALLAQLMRGAQTPGELDVVLA